MPSSEDRTRKAVDHVFGQSALDVPPTSSDKNDPQVSASHTDYQHFSRGGG